MDPPTILGSSRGPGMDIFCAAQPRTNLKCVVPTTVRGLPRCIVRGTCYKDAISLISNLRRYNMFPLGSFILE